MFENRDVQEGDPAENGTYVCYVDLHADHEFPYPKKKLLMWIGGRWGYPGSDQDYRGKVHGWLGPLPCPKMKDFSSKAPVQYAISCKPDGYHGAFKDGPFKTVQEALESIADKGDFIFQLIMGEKPKAIARWNDETVSWIRRKKK